MIKKSIAVFIILFITYNYVIIPYFISKHPELQKVSQSQWQDNIIIAQEYMHGQVMRESILVGSSLSARISDSSWHNLAFLGGSAMTGLELIKLKRNLPKTILIETNLIARNVDQEIISSVDTSLTGALSEILPTFLVKNQPLKNAGSLFYSAVHEKEAPGALDSSLFKKLVNIKLHESASLTDKSSIDDNLVKLKNLVTYFYQKGIQVYFIEMPIFKPIYETKNETYRRNQLAKQFPETNYNWIRPEYNIDYPTTDGMHLTEESALKFKLHIKKRINFKNYDL